MDCERCGFSNTIRVGKHLGKQRSFSSLHPIGKISMLNVPCQN
jgi:hypothetical protein